ncbi:unnamed protein product [Acanthoscelides obtectus]|uniref:Uncharacterized protein n=1 Tax=Acanthoscelides obtectus TaxID=200917 RepID=A0A9P0JI37_ACAOB|nr:unnamed protein product [Acanthoscelides obtectus]CAK1678665.1 hypothetical protein AOBTE_LOCUS31987 [Acanthoscelides obtectus]
MNNNFEKPNREHFLKELAAELATNNEKN